MYLQRLCNISRRTRRINSSQLTPTFVLYLSIKTFKRMDTLVKLVSIVIIMVGCLFLGYIQLISYPITALLMLVGIGFIALGGKFPKIIYILAILFTFIFILTNAHKPAFDLLMSAMFKLFLVLCIFFFIFRMLFSNSSK